MRRDSTARALLSQPGLSANRYRRRYDLYVRDFNLKSVSLPPLLFDAALALVLWAVGAAQLLAEQDRMPGRGGGFGGPGGGPGGGGPQQAAPDNLSFLLLGLASAGLVLRRRYPLPSLLWVSVFGALYLSRGEPTFTFQVIALVAIYTAVADSDTSRLTSIAVALMAGGILALGLYASPDPMNNSFWAMNGAWALAAVFLGDSVRSRREAALQAERSREEEALRRVSDERLQIARELHDVVGHNIALISVQAGAGAHVLYKDPVQAQETFNNIRNASHETLQELRSLVGVLRQDVEESTAPTTGLDALDQLIKSVAETGQSVHLTVRGSRRPLAGIVDLSAYRILQEALTNAVKHAPNAEVDVSLEYSADDIALEVLNGPGDDSVEHEPSVGHGLAGMRERVNAIGGRLDAGPRPDGGFRVHAVLPLQGAGQ